MHLPGRPPCRTPPTHGTHHGRRRPWGSCWSSWGAHWRRRPRSCGSNKTDMINNIGPRAHTDGWVAEAQRQIAVRPSSTSRPPAAALVAAAPCDPSSSRQGPKALSEHMHACCAHLHSRAPVHDPSAVPEPRNTHLPSSTRAASQPALVLPLLLVMDSVAWAAIQTRLCPAGFTRPVSCLVQTTSPHRRPLLQEPRPARAAAPRPVPLTNCCVRTCTHSRPAVCAASGRPQVRGQGATSASAMRSAFTVPGELASQNPRQGFSLYVVGPFFRTSMHQQGRVC